MAEIKIRKSDFDDVPSIAALHLAAWQQAYAGMIPANVLDDLSLAGFSDRWQERIANSKSTEHVYTAVAEDQILGFIMFGESREAMDLPQDFGEIYALYVHPDHWGKGTGKALIRYALSWFSAHHYPGVFLWTLKENKQARQFYERVGMFLVPQERYINTHGVELLSCCYCSKSNL